MKDSEVTIFILTIIDAERLHIQKHKVILINYSCLNLIEFEIDLCNKKQTTDVGGTLDLSSACANNFPRIQLWWYIEIYALQITKLTD